MEEELRALKEQYGGENPSEDVDEEYIAALTTFMYDNAPEEVKEAYNNDDYDNDAVHEWEQFVLSGTPYDVQIADDASDDSGIDHAHDNDLDTISNDIEEDEDLPSDSVDEDMADEDYDSGMHIEEHDEPHDEKLLAGETTPEEDAMLKILSGKRSKGLSGDMTPEEKAMLEHANIELQGRHNVVSDRTQKNIIKAISEHRY